MIVDVAPGMTLAQVIVRLRESHGDSVTVRILPESSLLLTANEFRALALAAEREQIAIAVETDDALRRQLASLFGVPLAIPIEPEPMVVLEPSHRLNGAADLIAEAKTAASPLPATDQEGTSELTTTTAEPAIADGNGIDAPARPKRAPALKRWILAIGALALIAVAGLAGYWWFFRSATVVLDLQTQPVTTTISFNVVPPGGQAEKNGQISIPAATVTFDLPIHLDGPATGVETIGNTAAEGTVVLRNSSSEPVSIAAGSTIETYEGDVFVFSEEVSVPAATPQGSAGEATAVVSAAEPGAAANRDIGMLSGRLENGIYFSNRSTPVAGGTDQTRTIVTQQDLDRLQAEAEQALQSLAATSSLSGNLRVVPSTLEQSKLETTFSHSPGEEAESLSVDATVTFEALAFSTDALDSAARQALEPSTPAGFALSSDPLTYDVPVETGESNGSLAMISPVTGQAVAQISQDEIDQLASDLTGMTEDEASELLQSDGRVTSYSLAFDPDWLPHRMPRDSDRIDLEVK